MGRVEHGNRLSPMGIGVKRLGEIESPRNSIREENMKKEIQRAKNLIWGNFTLRDG